MINVLVSQIYLKEKEIEFLVSRKGQYNLIVDSGAFTAFNAGKTVDLDAYCDMIKRLEFLQPFEYVQLDVIGNHEETMRNYLKMRDMGLNPVPVFTRGAPLEMLEKFYEMTDYVFIGGIARAKSDPENAFVRWIASKVGKRKMHLLGVTRNDAVNAARPYSVDSSTWIQCARYGNLSITNGHSFRGYSRKQIKKLDDRLLLALKKTGLPVSLFVQNIQNNEAWINRGYQSSFCVQSFAQTFHALNWVHHGMQMERRLGTKMFFACSFLDQIKQVFFCHDHLQEKGVFE
jgi:hypothetical protein